MHTHSKHTAAEFLAGGALTAALVLTAAGSAFAAPSVLINEEPLATDQPPVIVEGRTLVPMRAIFEALDCQVDWIADSQTIVATHALDSMTLTVGSDVLYLGTEEVSLDVPAQLIEGRTMVPLRAVAQALDADVAWDADSQTVSIHTPAVAHPATDARIAETVSHVQYDIAYPQFSEPALAALNAQLAGDAQASFQDARETFASVLSDLDETVTASHSFRAETRYAVTYNSADTVSILFADMRDYAGAHPGTTYRALTYDLTDNKILALSDILRGSQEEIDQRIIACFTERIERSRQAQPDSTAYFPDAETLLAEAVANGDYGFYLTEEGLVFFLQEYAIAPYAAGRQEAMIPASAGEEVFQSSLWQ